MLFTVAKIWEQPKCPSTDAWIKTMWFIYTMKDYSVIKKNEIMPFTAPCFDLELIIPNEVRKRKTKMPCDITYVWNLKYDTNELICETERDTQNRGQGCGCQGVWVEEE